ncbi:NAD(P)-binding domain-containing protein [Amycolatopsis sp. NPDC049253]|uniref:NADPH-dependent F420 reductase n=1 Tax=Amycolatopsis sp. NPDC049253 TaxID=3155274 RepID=UPI0034432D07
MRIALFGTGGMAQALGAHWSRHSLAVSGRDPGRATALARELGASALPWASAAEWADVVLLGLPVSALSVVTGLPLAGKVLIDCTNTPGDSDSLPPGTPVATRLAAAAPGALVVKAFNLAPVETWRMTPPLFEGRPLAVPLCGAPAAVDVVSELVRDVGCTPLPAGGLDRAALLEATAAFAIGLWRAGFDTRAAFVSG